MDILQEYKKTMVEPPVIIQGDIFWYNFGNVELPGVVMHTRPCIVVSNDEFNKTSPVVNIIAVSTKEKSSPVHVQVVSKTGDYLGFAMCEQLYTVNKNNLLAFSGHVSTYVLDKIVNSIKYQISAGLYS